MTNGFKRGHKIHFRGMDSQFKGFFVGMIEKLPIDFNGGDVTGSGELRCIVQQAGTGILLIKLYPTDDNRGWK